MSAGHPKFNTFIEKSASTVLYPTITLDLLVQFSPNLESQRGVVVSVRASHHCGPGSILGSGHTWAEFGRTQPDSEGFSPGTPVFLPPKYRLTANSIWLWCCAPRSCMDRKAAARGAFMCFRSDLVEPRPRNSVPWLQVRAISTGNIIIIIIK